MGDDLDTWDIVYNNVLTILNLINKVCAGKMVSFLGVYCKHAFT